MQSQLGADPRQVEARRGEVRWGRWGRWVADGRGHILSWNLEKSINSLFCSFLARPGVILLKFLDCNVNWELRLTSGVEWSGVVVLLVRAKTKKTKRHLDADEMNTFVTEARQFRLGIESSWTSFFFFLLLYELDVIFDDQNWISSHHALANYEARISALAIYSSQSELDGWTPPRSARSWSPRRHVLRPVKRSLNRPSNSISWTFYALFRHGMGLKH